MYKKIFNVIETIIALQLATIGVSFTFYALVSIILWEMLPLDVLGALYRTLTVIGALLFLSSDFRDEVVFKE